jgi:hypothetical protein
MITVYHGACVTRNFRLRKVYGNGEKHMIIKTAQGWAMPSGPLDEEAVRRMSRHMFNGFRTQIEGRFNEIFDEVEKLRPELTKKS